MRYLNIVLVLFALSGCKTPEATADVGPQGPQGIQGPKGDRGDSGRAISLDSTASRTCSHDVTINGAAYRLIFKKVVFASGDVSVSCSAGHKVTGGSGQEMTPAANATTASCTAYFDVSSSYALANYGAFVFNATNESVVYHQTGGAFDLTQYLYVSGDCQ